MMNRTLKQRIKHTIILLIGLFLIFYFGILFINWKLESPLDAFESISGFGRSFMYIITIVSGIVTYFN